MAAAYNGSTMSLQSSSVLEYLDGVMFHATVLFVGGRLL